MAAEERIIGVDQGGTPITARDVTQDEIEETLSPDGVKKRELTIREWRNLSRKINNALGKQAAPPSFIKEALHKRGF